MISMIATVGMESFPLGDLSWWSCLVTRQDKSSIREVGGSTLPHLLMDWINNTACMKLIDLLWFDGVINKSLSMSDVHLMTEAKIYSMIGQIYSIIVKYMQ